MSYIIESNSNKGEQNKDCGIQSIQTATKPRQEEDEADLAMSGKSVCFSTFMEGSKNNQIQPFLTLQFLRFLGSYPGA